MPDEDKKMVDIDTSGPDVDINLPEEKKDETSGIADIQVEETKETETTEKETDKTFENERETKLEEGGEVEKKEGKEDDKLEEYSKGVQSRIAKLTRKMREAERREKAALDYAKAVEEKRKTTETKFSKVNEDYVKQFENRVKDGLDSAQNN
jgi:DNA mismatch repair ATPase MutS